MARFFDGDKWAELIKRPDWYVKIYPELESLKKRWETEPDKRKADAMKHEVRSFFETGLENGKVSLAGSGPDLDRERQPIDTAIIHHTSAEPGYRLSYMNAVQLLNIYVPQFMKEGGNKPLWSNHVRSGRPVFYAYHWLMRMDGNFERLLKDEELGWHAANWDINCRSIAICLDNDYEDKDPKPEILHQLADFISKNYPHVAVGRISGHKEVSRHKTTCPGGNFTNGFK
jgi:hypothetical protein